MQSSRLSEQEEFIVLTKEHNFLLRSFTKLKDTCLFHCLQGEGSIEIDSIEYSIGPNTHAIFLPDALIGQVHTSNNFKAFYILFTHNLFREVTYRLAPSFIHFLQENPTATLPEEHLRPILRMQSLIEDLYHEQGNCFRRQIIRNNLQSLLLHIYDKTHRLYLDKHPEGLSRQEELFKMFIQLVHEHSTRHREVAFYAHRLCITSQYLSRITLSTVGKTSKKIIDKHAILEIKSLLRDTGLSVQEISDRLHFPDQSFFTRYFKKHTGKTPLQYRSEC